MSDVLRALAWPARNLSAIDALTASGLVARTYATKPKTRPKILVATHHKVLTVYFLNVFSRFAAVTNRRLASAGHEGTPDPTADILRSTHGRFDFPPGEWFGLHVIRDPRDLLVSAAKYHVRSTEAWLHVPRERYGGKTYQQAIAALPAEERLIFEMDNAAGFDIAQMLAWDYNQPGFSELRYEDLVKPGGVEHFRKAVERWNISASERRLLCALFEHFSVYGKGSRNLRHIRNPDSGQWRSEFSPRIAEIFDAKFPGVVAKLGYS